MTRTLLHAVGGAALALTLAGCANAGPYPDNGSLAYDYGYGSSAGFYGDYWDPGVGAFWAPGFHDRGVHHDEWHGGEGWHGGHLAFGGTHGGGFAGGHGSVGRG